MELVFHDSKQKDGKFISCAPWIIKTNVDDKTCLSKIYCPYTNRTLLEKDYYLANDNSLT